jgi:hypothetical protein
MLALILLAAMLQDEVVDVQANPGNSYRLSLVTTESAGAAYAKIEAAMAKACGQAGIKAKMPPFVGQVSRKPVRHQIMQIVTCNPPPSPSE